MSTNLLISIVTNMFQVDKIDIVVAFWNNICVSKLATFNAKDKVSDRRSTKLLMEEYITPLFCIVLSTHFT